MLNKRLIFPDGGPVTAFYFQIDHTEGEWIIPGTRFYRAEITSLTEQEVTFIDHVSNIEYTAERMDVLIL